MDIKLHLNATTTPKIRAYIQQSSKSENELAQELGVSLQTIRKWRNRSDIWDRSHTPNKIRRTLSAEQEILLVYLRRHLNLSLDELVEAVRMLINSQASRAGISRVLKKQDVGRISRNALPTEIGHVHFDFVCLPKALSPEADYLLVLIEKMTGFISFACLDEKMERKQNIIDYFKSDLLFDIKTIEISSNNKLAIDFARNLCKKNKIQINKSILIDVDFSKDFTKLVSGELTDSRLGFDALLLIYEEYLNIELARSRLNKLPPLQYINSIVNRGNN